MAAKYGHYEGNLDLRLSSRYEIKRTLAELRSVSGDLDLSGTPVTSLPEGLKVGGSLDLRGTSITSLPKGLKVGGRVIW